ncbi:hypothetical protein KCH_58980 [Kitasatospora cheerisanensis KCTC 2395]|uniref:Uncharacterized protein n=1 Tax=Kitasatospora cheerisanensis KCTC 2395 TaxID=1348663 RepID=A0A066YWA9_9ACTN|nr:hypothetical protein KCH_58980 [Kitasatospora cheerisanensis KCTC 2395]
MPDLDQGQAPQRRLDEAPSAAHEPAPDPLTGPPRCAPRSSPAGIRESSPSARRGVLSVLHPIVASGPGSSFSVLALCPGRGRGTARGRGLPRAGVRERARQGRLRARGPGRRLPRRRGPRGILGHA